MIINEEKHYIQFEKLKKHANVSHLFTLKPFNFRKTIVPDEEIQKQYTMVADILEESNIKFIKPIQTHTNIVKCVTEETKKDSFEDVDGLITNIKGIGLTTSLADCQGILLYDPKKQVIGNIHSGWKGTLHRIIKNAIDLMITNYHSNPEDIEAYICPSILKCCFEVDEDVKNDFEKEFQDISIESCITKGKVIDQKQKYFIDTTLINKRVLMQLGLKEENITISDICSKCHNDIIHSHRSEGVNSGRNIATIVLK
ncbi:MAG: peptidoglycan editing factor PgeF [Tenericutes bacterium]|nr:peptidoglycan editing factor PgeF [Mycoplasmatota bacterium]